MWWYVWAVLGALLFGGIVALLYQWPKIRCRRRHRLLQQARQQFHLRREYLEARFFTLASQSGKPRGLEWVECDFDDGVRFARDRQSGELRAFVGVTIRFRAVEGGGMEDVEAVGNYRAATAVFYYDGKSWNTHGRVLFNFNPDEAIEHFRHELETSD
jgi:hypothetical protein